MKLIILCLTTFFIVVMQHEQFLCSPVVAFKTIVRNLEQRKKKQVALAKSSVVCRLVAGNRERMQALWSCKIPRGSP